MRVIFCASRIRLQRRALIGNFPIRGFLLQTNGICIICICLRGYDPASMDATEKSPPNDRLFVQRIVRSSNSRRLAHERTPHDEPGLWLPRLQRAVRPVRADDPADHGSGDGQVFRRLRLLPARAGQRRGGRGHRIRRRRLRRRPPVPALRGPLRARPIFMHSLHLPHPSPSSSLRNARHG